MKYGVQLYSLRETAEREGAEKILQMVSEAGYDGVEFAGFYGHSAQDVRAMLEECGLRAVSSHVALKLIEADMQGVIDYHKAIGCDYIAVPYLSTEQRPGTPAFAGVLRTIYQFGCLCRDNCIQLLYHNHDFEFTKVEGQYGLDLMYQRVPASLLQTELDTCWINVAGEDPAAYLAKYTGRAPVVHLKDFVLEGRKPAHMYDLVGLENEKVPAEGEGSFAFRPLGHGMQDIPSILEAGKRAGARWFVVEQDEPSMGKTPLECAEMSRNYLKKLGV